jgi:prepilin-type processing-associated H-X9-DG protein
LVPNYTGYLLPAFNTVIRTYLCPSDNAQDAETSGFGGPANPGAVTDFTFTYGPDSNGNYWFGVDGVYDWPNFGHELGRTNYVGCSGGLGNVGPPAIIPWWGGWQRFVGIYYAGSKTRIADITDGTSHTIAFGETLGANGIGPRSQVIAWMGGWCLPTAWGLDPVYGPNNNDVDWWMFSSRHPGVVNFAFADGSVRPITTSVDFVTFVLASGMRDAWGYNDDDLGQ